MGLFEFVKDAGASVFGGAEKEKHQQEKLRPLEDEIADRHKGQALKELVAKLDIKVDKFDVKFLEGCATLSGCAPTQDVRERVVLLVGNTRGVAQVNDKMTVAVAASAPPVTMYTVKSGDTLGAIAKAHYGNAARYTKIFEANTPMLKDPNKIYPGQVLRIPSID